jgi:hypothetical protein
MKQAMQQKELMPTNVVWYEITTKMVILQYLSIFKKVHVGGTEYGASYQTAHAKKINQMKDYKEDY